jgi:hypothetical protein
MRLEIFVLGLTAFFVYNAYTDGKYTKMLMSFKKYYKMIFYAILGIGIYYILKRNPTKGKDMLLYANNYIKYLPIDKNSMDMLSPIIDFTGTHDSSFMESFNGIPPQTQTPGFCQEQKIISSARGVTNKRAVSTMRKKFVASNQDWKCGSCQKQLDHTYEVDHRIRLDEGGTNDVNNLVALCPSCHRYKTANELM